MTVLNVIRDTRLHRMRIDMAGDPAAMERLEMAMILHLREPRFPRLVSGLARVMRALMVLSPPVPLARPAAINAEPIAHPRVAL